MIKKTKIFKVSPNIAFTDLEGEKILLNLKSGNYSSLNNTGSLIFEKIDGKANVNEIIENICREQSFEISNIEQDVLNFFENLQDKKIII